MSEKQPRRPGRKPGIALLGVVEEQSEATIWESMLKAEGIPCLVRNLNSTAYLQGPVSPFGAAGPFEVYVPGTAIKRAQAIIGPNISHDRSRGAQSPFGQSAWLAWLVMAVLGVAFALGAFAIFEVR